MSEASPRSWRVEERDRGQRLDKHAAARLDVPRHRVQRWIREGRLALDRHGRRVSVKPSTVLEPADLLTCEIPAPEPDASTLPEDGPLEVLFADQDLIVVDKPAGLVVHPGAGRPSGTLVNRLLHRFPEIAEVGGAGRPGIVHRLDLDTTGVMVVARSERAFRRLSEDFASRQLGKIYLAVVHGAPDPPAAVIDKPIGRHPRDRTRMTLRPRGRPSVTGFETVAAAGAASLLRVRLETGRTHQIRVHMKAAGHPLVGDPVYGEARWRSAPRQLQKLLAGFPRPALHARRLELAHPATGDPVAFEAPVPRDLAELWRGLSGGEEEPWRTPG
ncbi:MAG: RluA family pseudouridine synthase [Acidobacteriota bacterium]